MKIAVVAPAGCVMPDGVQRAVAALHEFNITCQLGEHLYAQYRYFAGTTEQRLLDLRTACEDDSIDAIWCARGGVGAAQLVPFLGDWLLKKPLIGYSDITVLLNWIAMRGGYALHAPVVQELYDKNRMESAMISLDGQETLALLPSHSSLKATALLPHAVSYPVTCLAGEQSFPIAGKILGGNLAVLASLQGTAGALILNQPTILLIEDVGEAFYRLERLLVQLLQSVDTTQLKAIVLGEFYQCPQKNVPDSLEMIFAEHLVPRGIALYRGDWFGHGASNRPFWIGAMGTIEHNGLMIKM